MTIFWIFSGAISIILLLNFWQNIRTPQHITPIERDKDPSFAELLNYATMVDEGIILTREGFLIGGFFYKGVDIQSCTEDDLDSQSRVINETLKALGPDFVVQVDAIRTPSLKYPEPEKRFFPDPITRQIDNNRRDMFEKGEHHETTYVILLLTSLRCSQKKARRLNV